MQRYFIACLIGCLLLSSGCSTLVQRQCLPNEQMAVSEQLYFGTAKPGASVSSEEWLAFLAQTVTPRFPAGLTVWPASGQWQSADGSITKENSFVLSLVHAQDEATERAIQAVIAQYKSQFQQEAVLRVKSYACTSL